MTTEFDIRNVLQPCQRLCDRLLYLIVICCIYLL